MNRLFPLLAAFVLAAPISADEIDDLYAALLYPVVRVRTDHTGGSGTVIYSEDRAETGTFRTYILTNHHVVDDAISVTKTWDNLKQAWTVQEKNELVDVELFSWHRGRIIDRKIVKAGVVAHAAEDDIALLELRAGEEFYPLPVEHVGTLATSEEAGKLRVFQKIYAVGCSLGHEPIHSSGEITDLSDLHNGKTYMMGSAPIIFGNSGGAVFTQIDGQFRLIGMPSLVAVSWGGAVSHMNWCVPQTRISDFLRLHKLDFFFDSTKTPEECFTAREAERETSRDKEPKAKE